MYLFDPSRTPPVETRHAASPDRWLVGGGRSEVGVQEVRGGGAGGKNWRKRKYYFASSENVRIFAARK